MTPKTAPVLFQREEGQHVWFGGALGTIKLTSAITNGVIGLIECLLPVGFATPFHVHANEDEIFYIVEGEADYVLDCKLQTAVTGAVVFLPRLVPHGFQVVGVKPARILHWVTPAGYERVFADAGETALSPTLPPPTMPNVERLLEGSRVLGVKILGPLRVEIAKYR